MNKILNLFKLEDNIKLANFLKDGVYETVGTLKEKWSELSFDDKYGWYISELFSRVDGYTLIYPYSDSKSDHELFVNLFSLDDSELLYNTHTKKTVLASVLKYSYDNEDVFGAISWVLAKDNRVKVNSVGNEYVHYYTILDNTLVVNDTLVDPIKASILKGLWNSLKTEGRLGWTELYDGRKIYDSNIIPTYMPLCIDTEITELFLSFEDKVVTLSNNLKISLSFTYKGFQTGVGSFDFIFKNREGKEKIYKVHYKNLHYVDEGFDKYSLYFNIDYMYCSDGTEEYDFTRELNKTIFANKDAFNLFEAHIGFDAD